MSPILSSLILQIILIAVNAFFAASEIAVTSLNESKLNRLADDGDKKAATMLRMVAEPTGFLATIQIGITLAGFLASAFAAVNFSDPLVSWLVDTCGVTAIGTSALDTIVVIAITLILSFFTLILGELVPKRLAARKAESFARAVCPVILFLSAVLKPVVWLLTVSTNGVLRLCGVNPHESEESVSEDEIRMMIDIGEEIGSIESEEREMIDNIFEFNNITAGELMVHRKDMTVLWANDTPDEIFRTIVESGYSRFPVCGEDTDDVLGILRTRAYLLNAHSNGSKTLLELLSPVHFVPETAHADTLFREMQQKKMHMAVVVDEYGGTAGLITLEDLLESIVGNIYDETDEVEVQDITRIDENLWRVSGNCDLEELFETMELKYEKDPEANYSSLGGLIFNVLTQIPDDGDTPELETDTLKIHVEEISNHRVEWALVSKLPSKVEEDDEDEEDEKRDRRRRRDEDDD